MADKSHTYHADLTKRGVIKLNEPDMYTVWVKAVYSNLTSAELRVIADVTDNYGRGYVLFTTNQNAVIPFVNINDVAAVLEVLEAANLRLDRCGPTVRGTKVCHDSTSCHEAVTDATSLAQRLEAFFDRPLNHKTKIGVAGCGKDCISSRVLCDIGFVGTVRDGRVGYDVYVGGKLGLSPVVGVKMAESLREDDCVRLLENYFDVMGREGKPDERSGDLLRRVGMTHLREELLRGLPEEPPSGQLGLIQASGGQADGRITVKVRATLGQVRSMQLRKIADVAEAYGRGFVHLPMRCYPEIPGIDPGQLEAVSAELESAGVRLLNSGTDNIQGCCFGRYCTENVADPHPLLLRIEQLVTELDVNNQSLSVSAAGCPNCCGFPQLSDVGFYGAVEPRIDPESCNGCELCVAVCRTRAITMKQNIAVIDLHDCRHCGQCLMVCPVSAISPQQQGFHVLVGGQDGGDVQLGTVIAKFASPSEVLQITERALKLLQEANAKMSDLVRHIGLDRLCDILLDRKQ